MLYLCIEDAKWGMAENQLEKFLILYTYIFSEYSNIDYCLEATLLGTNNGQYHVTEFKFTVLKINLISKKRNIK